jgi:hypothetical protein
MPAHHRVWRDDRQVLTPADEYLASQHPQQLVPGTKPRSLSATSRPGQHRELMTQEQVLEDEIVARARPSRDGHEQQPEEFEHIFSIADWGARGFASPQLLVKDQHVVKTLAT